MNDVNTDQEGEGGVKSLNNPEAGVPALAFSFTHAYMYFFQKEIFA